MSQRHRTRSGAAQNRLSAWNRPTWIKSIQSGTITLATTTSNTATLSTAVDVNNSVLHFTGNTSNGVSNSEANSSPYLTFTDSTTITASLPFGGALTVIVGFMVIEYFPGMIKSVQRGLLNWTGTTTQTAALTTVATERSVLVWMGWTVDNTDGLRPRLAITSGTLVTATIASASGDHTRVPYQVVEYY